MTAPPLARDAAVLQPHRLRFACSCASAAPDLGEPWVAVAKEKKLNDGTKELILNAIYRHPRTIAQLAEQLGLSQPAIHRHIAELLASDLIREVAVSPADRAWPVERYYRPNFPVVLAADSRLLEPAIEALAGQVAALFREHQAALAALCARTSLADDGRQPDELLHYLYAAVTRAARQRLEQGGDLPPWPAHRDGSRWVWWAEETQEAGTRGEG